ncbi:hypothetical protein GGI12_003771 [Dipsacomyces acuminosporus]|nr:hypothetical protein GGI12_003771 [Dipsacomyces acuminosporus]
MGQASSKAAAKGMRLPRSTSGSSTSMLRKAAAAEAKEAKSAMKTREQMLSEDAKYDNEEQETKKMADSLKYFLNPKELLTPITPENPDENINVQALKSRREDDDIEIVGQNRLKSAEISKLLKDLSVNSVDAVAKKYGLAADSVRNLAQFLEPIGNNTAK